MRTNLRNYFLFFLVLLIAIVLFAVIAHRRNIEQLTHRQNWSTDQDAGISVVVPPIKSAYQEMADGRARITFECQPQDRETLKQWANERGLGYQITVSRKS